MANVLGLGVFGTFGQPHGFQQAFSADVQFVHSLDLNGSEIELFPNTELFVVKKEVVRGVYSVCFCMYSYVREMNANRSTTFLGSCIVLQQVYIDPEKIYKLLRELHDDLVNNAQNVNNNTIQVRQAVNLVVREPAQFQSARFSVRSLDETPFYSTKVDPQKKYFVQTEHIESASQVITFFDEALKNYNDVESLYFSFNEKVINAVIRKGNLKNIKWDEFVDYKNLMQQGVVRTKKGLKPTPQNFASAVVDNIPAEQILAVTEPVNTEPVVAVTEPVEQTVPITEPIQAEPQIQTEPEVKLPVQADTFIHDPNFPFDGWGEPNGSWALEEVFTRVHEYNRLLGYAKHLKTHNDDLLEAEQKIKDNISKAEQENADVNKWQNQALGNPPGNNITEEHESEEDYNEKKPFYKRQYFLLIAFGILLVIFSLFYFIISKRIFRKPLPNSYDTTVTTDAQPIDTTKLAAPPSTYQDTNTNNKVDSTVAAQQAPPDTPKVTPKTPVIQLNAKPLNPQSNIELIKSEADILSKAGIKNRSLSDITNMIFQKFPVNIGDVYKHQFDNYAKNLLIANKNAFEKKGNDYICITDALIHIPAYKSQRVPVAFPK